MSGSRFLLAPQPAARTLVRFSRYGFSRYSVLIRVSTLAVT